ncbi:hypothetical protein BGL41_04650 [Fructilactobacillus sanfranciscensis]|uniref:glutaredoxin-like protein NrdH n=1 Tax=Fructilactobacillus sanfranciscensis TaxID=1625 RepID=UPI000CD48C5E|nr:glutaredoxin-like protein NrdH [Fructilactobacillus sanfranciscensis]POH13414.1 hypothetical protein BGL41_04650 [Fructilactobacillus sanfranciscensis]
MDKEVIVYSKDNCVQCKMTKQELNRNGIEFKEINLDHVNNADDIRAELREQGFQATPVVKTENETWTGFRPAKIKQISND